MYYCVYCKKVAESTNRTCCNQQHFGTVEEDNRVAQHRLCLDCRTWTLSYSIEDKYICDGCKEKRMKWPIGLYKYRCVHCRVVTDHDLSRIEGCPSEGAAAGRHHCESVRAKEPCLTCCTVSGCVWKCPDSIGDCHKRIHVCPIHSREAPESSRWVLERELAEMGRNLTEVQKRYTELVEEKREVKSRLVQLIKAAREVREEAGEHFPPFDSYRDKLKALDLALAEAELIY